MMSTLSPRGEGLGAVFGLRGLVFVTHGLDSCLSS